jgi:hypothetical protein
MTVASDEGNKKERPKGGEYPRDAQRADSKQTAREEEESGWQKRKERLLRGKNCVVFPEGGLSVYGIQSLH